MKSLHASGDPSSDLTNDPSCDLTNDSRVG